MNPKYSEKIMIISQFPNNTFADSAFLRPLKAHLR